MHLAMTGLFRARWTDQIHDEWIRNVLANRPDLKAEQLKRTRELMDAHALDCLVTGYEKLIAGLTLPDPDDRHVLAAAIRASVCDGRRFQPLKRRHEKCRCRSPAQYGGARGI